METNSIDYAETDIETTDLKDVAERIEELFNKSGKGVDELIKFIENVEIHNFSAIVGYLPKESLNSFQTLLGHIFQSGYSCSISLKKFREELLNSIAKSTNIEIRNPDHLVRKMFEKGLFDESRGKFADPESHVVKRKFPRFHLEKGEKGFWGRNNHDPISLIWDKENERYIIRDGHTRLYACMVYDASPKDVNLVIFEAGKDERKTNLQVLWEERPKESRFGRVISSVRKSIKALFDAALPQNPQ